MQEHNDSFSKILILNANTLSKFMKKVTSLLMFALFYFLILTAQAQDENVLSSPSEPATTGFYLGAQASTNGWGFSAKYTVNNWLAVKTGFETLSFSYNFDFNESDVEYNADMNYNTGGILLLADFSYTKNLYVSAGLVFNSFNPKMEGFAISDLNYGDIVIPAEDIGTFKFEMEPGLKASPYVAAGVQSFLGKNKRMVFNFETGIYYMGGPKFKLTSDGLLSPTSDPDLGQAEYLEDQFSAYKIYPVIKLNLAYRIF